MQVKAGFILLRLLWVGSPYNASSASQFLGCDELTGFNRFAHFSRSAAMRHYQTAVNTKWAPLSTTMKEAGRPTFSPRSQGVPIRKSRAIRLDSQIRRDVIDEIQSELTIDADSIEVHVENGVVTLTGCADGCGDKWLIEVAAQRIAGVRSVETQLEIKVEEPGMRSDDDIRRECEHMLGMTVPGANHAIRVMVSSGWVTLSGSVAWGYERWSSEEIVNHVPGVNGVNGQITVQPLDLHDV
jgi:osmotically-inducible protein OsmY